jgi:hypothetical protein
MGGAPLIIPLVALVLPITLLLLAIAFDTAVIVWALYRMWHNYLQPGLVALGGRTLTSARLGRQYGYRLLHHHKPLN